MPTPSRAPGHDSVVRSCSRFILSAGEEIKIMQISIMQSSRLERNIRSFSLPSLLDYYTSANYLCMKPNDLGQTKALQSLRNEPIVCQRTRLTKRLLVLKASNRAEQVGLIQIIPAEDPCFMMQRKKERKRIEAYSILYELLYHTHCQVSIHLPVVH